MAEMLSALFDVISSGNSCPKHFIYLSRDFKCFVVGKTVLGKKPLNVLGTKAHSTYSIKGNPVTFHTVAIVLVLQLKNVYIITLIP